tara:strand:- start:7 stop:477 length:471 start_codon:yes stop_codon:yes gene_type:complete
MEELNAAIANLLEVFEEHIVKKYGLLDVSGKGPKPTFMKATEVPDSKPETGDSKRDPTQEKPSFDEEYAAYMYEAKNNATTPVPETRENVSEGESVLQTEALDTVCTIGEWKGKTFREMWDLSQEGEDTVKVIAKSQHPLAKAAAIVVAFYEEGDE